MVINLGFVTCYKNRFIAVMSHVDYFNCSPSFPLSPTLLHTLYGGHWQWLTFSISGQTVTELKSLRNDGWEQLVELTRQPLLGQDKSGC